MSTLTESIKLISNEENEIFFEVVIQGTSSERLDPPKLRFILEDKSNGMSFVFPCEKDLESGEVKVTVPRMEKFINETKDYKGSLEVIVGDQYFVPQTINIKFIRPVRVESKGVRVSKDPGQPTELREAPKPSVKSKVITKPAVSKPVQRQTTQETKKVTTKKPSPRRIQQEQKNKIKDMIRDVLKDYDS